MKNLLLLLLIFTLTSCKDDEIVFVPPVIEDDTVENPTNLDVVWQEEMIDIDFSDSYSISPFIYEGDVFYSIKYGTPTEYLIRRDGETGQMIWKSTNDDIGSITSKEGNAISNGKLGVASPALNVFDLESGEIIGKSEKPFYDIRIESHNGYFYQAFYDSDVHNSSSLYRTSDDGQNWELVCKVDNTDGYEANLHAPAFYENTSGETIIIFQNRQFNFDILDGKVDLLAYNIDADSLIWSRSDIDPVGNSSVHAPIVENNLVYFLGATRMSCTNINTGELIWNQTAGALTCNLVLTDDKIIINGEAKNIIAFDKNTGVEIWINSDLHSENSPVMTYHNGIIYFVSNGNGTLCAVKEENGETIWSEDSPNDDTFNGLGCRSGLAINPDLGLIYFVDGRYIVAVRLAEL
ncbi:MAG: outer membrane protein assembly factor BamB [Saprospiraceae bacterium]|jgi:outer membrane protein assembly factor BamB